MVYEFHELIANFSRGLPNLNTFLNTNNAISRSSRKQGESTGTSLHNLANIATMTV